MNIQIMKKKVLFLCTGNSCRSQMAEGWLRHLYGDWYEACSAGTHPTRLHPKAVFVMAERRVDISMQRSKSVYELANEPFDIVITVCDNAREECPVFPFVKGQLHWGFPDPAVATGTEEEILEVFCQVRDAIYEKIKSAFLPENVALQKTPSREKI